MNYCKITEEEFNKKYPHWFETDENNKFNNLPFQQFILIDARPMLRIGDATITAIDNTSGDAWTEDFKSIRAAKRWLNQK